MKPADIQVGQWVQKLCDTPYEAAGLKCLITAVGENTVLAKTWIPETNTFQEELKKSKERLVNNFSVCSDPTICVVKDCRNKKSEVPFIGNICCTCLEQNIPTNFYRELRSRS